MTDCALILCASNVFPALGSTLPSCCKDIYSMFRWYTQSYDIKGAPFVALQNERFTHQNFSDHIHTLLKDSGIKRGLLDFSSHGTVIPINGENHAAIVCADSTWDDLGTFILAEDLEKVFAAYPDVRFYMTADACESADLAFKALSRGVTKFIDPPGDIQMMIDHNIASGGAHRSIAPVLPNVAYVSGTGGKGFYSIDEGDGGAFTKHWTAFVKPTWTAEQIATELDKVMDSQQQPQSHGGLKASPWFS